MGRYGNETLWNSFPRRLSHEGVPLHGMQGVRSSSLLGSILQILPSQRISEPARLLFVSEKDFEQALALTGVCSTGMSTSIVISALSILLRGKHVAQLGDRVAS